MISPEGRWIVAACAALLALAPRAPARDDEPLDLDDVAVGQWVILKGTYDGLARFTATEVEIAAPEELHQLVGTIEAVEPDGFVVLGQSVEVSEKTRWRKELDLGSLASGMRVDVEGHYRGPRKFSAREVSPREPGRDRLSGRLEAVQPLPGGGLELRVTRYTVTVLADADVELDEDLAEDIEGDLSAIPLAPFVEYTDPDALAEAEIWDEDDVRLSFRLTDTLYAGANLEWRSEEERDFDLDSGTPEDRRDDELSLRTEFVYDPEGNFSAFLRVNSRYRWRDDEKDGFEFDEGTRVAEVWGLWRDVEPGVDLKVGRQDFDDEREWLYDENLDALRLTWRGDDLRLELSASRVLSDGSEALEATDNFIAYLSTTDDDRHLAAYLIDRRDDREVRDYPFLAGVRALGEWFPDHEVWAEAAVVRGYTGDVELDGYGFDVGTTWSPAVLGPWYLTAGYAFGSGDSDRGDSTDGSFRQSGLQDNNGRFGGVTSFRYYGELLDPELSNLRIATLGLGRRFTKRHSLDLVWHRYEQDVAADRLRNSDLDRRPNGVDPSLGDEIDLVWGSRWSSSWGMEIVLARFLPGDAFDENDDPATYAKFQLRYRF